MLRRVLVASVGKPAGVQADSTSLTKLVSSGVIYRYETEDGMLTLHVPAQGNGALWQTNVQVIATLAGTLHSGASSMAPEGNLSKKKEFAPVTGGSNEGGPVEVALAGAAFIGRCAPSRREPQTRARRPSN